MLTSRPAAGGPPPDGHHLYAELAPWWPVLSPVEEYAEDAVEVDGLLRTARRPVHTVLELGSGGGHVAAHLRDTYELTLVDLSEAMLAVSRALNPRCAHHVGDMRTTRLGRTFDAVFIHDAIDYMSTRDDLRAALRTAFVHCTAGGVVVLLPDHTTDTFAPSTDHGGSDAADGRAARYLEWTWDPDPSDDRIQTEYVFVLRHADGIIETVHDTHRTGLFPRAVWLELIAEVGFEAGIVTERVTMERTPRDVFVGHRGVD